MSRMDLTNQSQIQIQNKIFTLGSPVTHADTLDQLLYVFQQMGVTERPIVIINPVGDALPDLANLLENYIENAMQGAYTTQRTTYLFQDYTDEQIIEWANTIKDILPENRLDIKFKVAGENSRVLIVTPHGKEYEELCEAVL